jgi:hypothetical protein
MSPKLGLKSYERLLGTFERRVLRRTYDPLGDGQMRRSRYNMELCGLLEEADSSSVIRFGRLWWVGHVMRAEEKEMQKRILITRWANGNRKTKTEID